MCIYLSRILLPELSLQNVDNSFRPAGSECYSYATDFGEQSLMVKPTVQYPVILTERQPSREILTKKNRLNYKMFQRHCQLPSSLQLLYHIATNDVHVEVGPLVFLKPPSYRFSYSLSSISIVEKVVCVYLGLDSICRRYHLIYGSLNPRLLNTKAFPEKKFQISQDTVQIRFKLSESILWSY